MRSLVLTALFVLIGACGAPAIESGLVTDDIPLPNRQEPTDGGRTKLDSSTGDGEKFTVTVTLTGSGNVSSAPTGVTCSGMTCTGSFPKGTALTLAAVPTAGALFGGWGGPCTGVATCAVTVDKALAITADFPTLDGSWSGTYTNTRPSAGCTFNNAGNLNVTVKTTGGVVSHSANVTGLELRSGAPNCTLVGGATGTAPDAPVTGSTGAVTGTWNFDVQQGGQSYGNLAFPFTAKISGKTMTGSWTCPGCVGTFSVTKP